MKKLYNIFNRFVRKIRTDSAFAKKLQASAEQFKAKFSEEDIIVLQSACRTPSFQTAIKGSDFSYANPSSVPLVTIVVLGCETDHQLERCFFVLSKQIVKDIQLILVGKGNIKRLRSIANIPDLTGLTLKSNANAQNAHALAMPHARGKYTVFIRPTDLLHPSFCKELLEIAGQSGADMVIARKSCGKEVLPPLPLETGGADHFASGEFLEQFEHMAAESGPDIFGVLFDTRKLRSITEKACLKTIRPWLRQLHVLHYIKESGTICRTRNVLLKESWYHPTYQSLISYSLGLKHFDALAEFVRNAFPSNQAWSILRCLVFHNIPSTLAFLTSLPRSLLRLTVIYSHVAFYVLTARQLFPEATGTISSITLSGLNYGRFMSSVKVFSVHDYFIREAKLCPEGILVYETENMEDISNNFLPDLQAKYTVRRLIKKSFNEDTQLEFLVCALLAEQSVFILASNRMDGVATSGRTVVQAWHGYGLMKKILPASSDPAKAVRFKQEYVVASSEACREEYSSIFEVRPENVLAFGSLQTDRYFDSEERSRAVAEAKAEFPELAGRRICFFAPTFRKERVEDPPRYSCGWDYAEADVELERSNTAVVFKQHHIFKSLKLNKGITTSDLRDSPRGLVRETCLPDIFTWICACDVFMTDFSSAMFLPLLLDKPIVFFAPDLDDYLSKGKGTLIDYRNDVPGPIIQSSSMRDLLTAMDQSLTYPGSEQYRRFKEHHMGACDGRSGKRLMDFVDAFYHEELGRLAAVSQ